MRRQWAWLAVMAHTALMALLLVLSGCALDLEPGPRLRETTTAGDSTDDLQPFPIMPGPTPTQAWVLERGKGAVVGRVVFHTSSPERMTVFLAPFLRIGPEDQGYYVLEPSVHPRAPVEVGGFFEVLNVEPGYYVMLIGARPMDDYLVGAEGRPRIIEVLADEVVNVGEIPYRRD